MLKRDRDTVIAALAAADFVELTRAGRGLMIDRCRRR
jgi:hypothetical protein